MDESLPLDLDWSKEFSPDGIIKYSNIPAFPTIAISDRSAAVKYGLWRDHSLPAWRSVQILIPEQHAQMISNIVAITLALTLPRLLSFVKLLLPVILKGSSYLRRLARRILQPRPGATSITTPNLTIELEHVNSPAPVRPARISAGLADTFLQASSFENGAGRLIRNHLAMPRLELTDNDRQLEGFWRRTVNILVNLKDNPLAFTKISVLVLILFLVFVGQQVLAICAATIVSNSVALSASDQCGAWSTLDTGHLSNNNSVFEPVRRHYKNLAKSAIAYAETCYSTKAKMEHCHYAYKPVIEFYEFHNVSCPFQGDVCLLMNNSAFALDTGYVDSDVVGINERERVRFRLTKICAPLVVNETYIKVQNPSHKETRTVSYWYGNPRSGQPTLREEYPAGWANGNLDWRYPVFVHNSEAYDADSNILKFGLLPEFLAPNAKTTILFISSEGIKYTQHSDDPIFPAQHVWGYGVGWNAVWENTIPHRTVLGCADTVQILNPRTGEIWYPMLPNRSVTETENWKGPGIRNSAFLVGTALRNADWVYPMAQTFGDHLDANEKMFAAFSSPLAKEQWKVEARKWFQTDLARLQWGVLNMAQGYGHDLPYAVDWAAEIGFNVCSNVKFISQGWKNVNLFGLVSLLFLALLIWALTIEVQQTIALVWLIRDGLIPMGMFVIRLIIAVIRIMKQDIWPWMKVKSRTLKMRVYNKRV